jgi:hypothetical protein
MNATKTAHQVVSKQRVTDHGEVLTAEREVNAMLNLVHHETERVDSRFLEPACGTGNFLAPILERKLAVMKRKYGKSQLEFERYAIVATGSIYGVDILEDNVRHCRERLFTIFNDMYTALYKNKCKDSYRDAIRYVLSRNILWGDALSLKTVTKQPTPIVFSEWSLVRGSMVKRRDYSFAELIPDGGKNGGLFADMNVSDIGTPVFIPKPVKEFPLTHVLNLAHENTN